MIKEEKNVIEWYEGGELIRVEIELRLKQGENILNISKTHKGKGDRNNVVRKRKSIL